MISIEKMSTRLTAAWIEQVTAGNPARVNADGNVVLPPARLAFADVVTVGKDRIEDGVTKSGSYGATLLFAPNADLSALVNARAAKIREFFPQNPDGHGLKDVVRDQADRVSPAEGGKNPQGKTYAGFVPGSKFVAPNANPDFRPGLFKLENGVPVAATGPEDELKRIFFAGIWVIATVNIFHGKSPKNPGAFLGLRSILKIADDNALGGGGGGGSAADFGSVKIDAPTDGASLM